MRNYIKNYDYCLVFIILFFIVMPAVSVNAYNYETFTNKQFKIHLPNNWKKKTTAQQVRLNAKQKNTVYAIVKEVNLTTRGATYLANKQANKFSLLYKKKIKKQYYKLEPLFQNASKFKIKKYQVIRLQFALRKGELNAYYITNGSMYHRIITICRKTQCVKQNKKFSKIVYSFRFVPDTTAPTFDGITSATATSTSGVTLTWEAALDSISSPGDISYSIYEANQLEEQDYSAPTYQTEAAATSYEISGLQEGTSYYYVVRAHDEAGNRDLNTTELVATTKVTTDSNPTTTDSAELVSYESNGSTVQGLMYRPAGAGRFPVIIYNHGGVTASDPSSFASTINELSESGTYVVLATPYRGDLGSDGDLSIGLGDVNDILAAIEYVKSKDYVDADRIGLFGESRGGNSTLSAAARNPGDIKAVVSWYPYTNLVTYCEYIGYAVCLGYYGADADDYTHHLRIGSPVNYADKLTMPLQNSHGTSDIVVPHSQSEELNDVMDGMDNYTFYSYDGSGHGWSGDVATTARERRSEFFANNL